MKQKLIFLDIDGTLLPPGEMIVPESAVDAIHRARANGHKVFLCTGRNLRMTQPLFHYGFDGFVCSAGGYVGCDGKILVDIPMEPEQVSGLRAALERAGADIGGEALTRAPMPGLLRAVDVVAGQSVQAGDRLAVLEAMKMEHSLTASRDGVVAEVLAAPAIRSRPAPP